MSDDSKQNYSNDRLPEPIHVRFRLRETDVGLLFVRW